MFVDPPHIRRYFPSLKFPQPRSTDSAQPSLTSNPQFAARNNLSDLGMLLPELCFRQPIESQDLRKCNLGPDGKRYEPMDYMTTRDWAELVSEEYPALEHILKCCVFCAFEEEADWDLV